MAGYKDGKLKIRAVDDLTASGVNGCTKVTEKLKCENIDMLFEGLQEFRSDSEACSAWVLRHIIVSMHVQCTP